MNYAYYRVSTSKQDYNSQKVGVLEYCNRLGITIDKEIVDDGVSGTVKAKDRKLGKLLKVLEKGDFLITSELSRLGRSTSDVLNTCSILSKKEVSVWFVKQCMGLDSSPMGKMMTAIMGAFAELERDLISQRTLEGLKRAREKGVILGRPCKSGSGSYKLEQYKDEVIKLYKDGIKVAQIASGFNVDRSTIHRCLIKWGVKYGNK